MTEARKALLEDLPGWVWDAIAEQWEQGFRCLAEYYEKEGHCNVPAKYQTNEGYPLGNWVGNRRHSKDKMQPTYKTRLEALPGWCWNPQADKWRIGFAYLKEYSNRERHSKIPRDYKTEDGYRLGQWVGVQRTSKEVMPVDRKTRLESLPGWYW